jgi:F-type H+-transporting ATPase subunit alpha
MVELLKQPQYEPMPVEQQVISIFAGFNGYLDDLPTESIRKFEQGLLAFVADKYPDVPEGIRNSGVLSDATESALRKAIEEFKGTFTAS